MNNSKSSTIEVQKGTKVIVYFDSEEARRFDNLADPTRIQYEKMSPEAIVGASQEEEVLDDLRYAYDAIDSFFEKYPFEPTPNEKNLNSIDCLFIEKQDIAFLRSKFALAIDKIKKFGRE